jgi:hypothetical protein
MPMLSKYRAANTGMNPLVRSSVRSMSDIDAKNRYKCPVFPGRKKQKSITNKQNKEHERPYK